MKKTLLCLTIALFACIALTGLSFAAAAPTKSLSVSATISSVTPEIDIAIMKNPTNKNDPFTTGTDVTSTMKLDFGTLVHNYTDTTGTHDAGVWFSNNFYCVGIYTQGYGARYEVKSTCTGIGTISNTNKYFSLGVVYSPLDRWVGSDPSTAQLARPVTATLLGVASNTPPAVSAISTTFNSIYKSESAPSTARIIQAWYGIPPRDVDPITGLPVDPFTGWTGLPLTQAGGTYIGTVTLSIVAI